MLKNDSFLDNDDVLQILGNTSLSAEKISSVKDFFNELDKSRSDMIKFYRKTADDKASLYNKQMEYLNDLYSKEVEYIIRISEKEDITPDQEEKCIKKIAEIRTDAQRVFSEIIAEANEESDKDATKSQKETERSPKRTIEAFSSVTTIIAGATLVLAGTGVVIKNPKNSKVGVGLIGSGFAILGVPVAKKLLPLLQEKDDAFPDDVIIIDA